MHRILIPPDAVEHDVIAIRESRALHHLNDVLRIRVGSSLECFDGTGRSYNGRIVRKTAQSIVLQVQTTVIEKPLPVTLHLAQTLIRPERFIWIIQKATELGVASIHPVVTERTVVRYSQDAAHQKVRRWQRIAQEAAQQCKRATVPQIHFPQPFAKHLKSHESAFVLIPTLSASAKPLEQILGQNEAQKSVTILIGPEGDFTDKEVQDAQHQGAIPVSLGRLTLRSETAAIAVLAMILYAKGLTRKE